MKKPPEAKLGHILVSEAASLLGVKVSTLRLWDKSGELKAGRNPQTNYRLYKIRDLELFARLKNLKPKRQLRP